MEKGIQNPTPSRFGKSQLFGCSKDCQNLTGTLLTAAMLRQSPCPALQPSTVLCCAASTATHSLSAHHPAQPALHPPGFVFFLIATAINGNHRERRRGSTGQGHGQAQCVRGAAVGGWQLLGGQEGGDVPTFPLPWCAPWLTCRGCGQGRATIGSSCSLLRASTAQQVCTTMPFQLPSALFTITTRCSGRAVGPLPPGHLEPASPEEPHAGSS